MNALAPAANPALPPAANPALAPAANPALAPAANPALPPVAAAFHGPWRRNRRGPAAILLPVVFAVVFAIVFPAPAPADAAALFPAVPSESPSEEGRPGQAPAPEGPPIRVGLADGVPAALLTAPAPFTLRAGELAIETAWVLVSPETGPAEPVFALGSFPTEDAADETAEAFRERGGAGVRVRRNPEDGRYLPIPTEIPPSSAANPEAGPADRLRAAGFPGAGEYPLAAAAGDALVLRPVGGAPIRIPGGVPLAVTPPAAGFLEWEGRPYRGEFTVFRRGAGVTVVNRLPLEDYLLGVVPRELPPDLFPELDALKAQALAARTYALRPRDAYRERGYDLCSGPACQVYGGAAAERPLSTRAVRETAGEAIYHEGAPIDALYTAACGGHTENAENIFTNPTPYLVGRAGLRESGGARLAAAGAAPLDAAVARAAGALPPEWLRSGDSDADRFEVLAAPATPAEARSVLMATADFLGIPTCPPTVSAPPTPTLTLAAFGELAQVLRCRSPARAAAPSGASPFGPTPEEAPGEPPAGVRALLDEGLLDPGDRGLAPNRPVTRREVLAAAAALLERERPLFRRGQVRRAGNGLLLVEEDSPAGAASDALRGTPAGAKRLFRLTPANDALLYRETLPIRIPGRPDAAPLLAPVPALTARLGDFVRFHAAPAEPRPEGYGGSASDPASPDTAPEIRFGILILEDLGETWDRFSRQRSWLVPKDAGTLAEAAARLKPIGDLLALEPLEYGVSGRIVRLRLVGSEGSLEVRGLGVRRVLGLSDNLFFAEPRYTPDGRLRGYWFTGRGWGHGLGLCQAGAYGMAAAGADYRQILAHYYPGTEIRR